MLDSTTASIRDDAPPPDRRRVRWRPRGSTGRCRRSRWRRSRGSSSDTALNTRAGTPKPSSASQASTKSSNEAPSFASAEHGDDHGVARFLGARPDAPVRASDRHPRRRSPAGVRSQTGPDGGPSREDGTMKKLIAAVTTAGLLVVGTAGIAGATDAPKDEAPGRGQPPPGPGRVRRHQGRGRHHRHRGEGPGCRAEGRSVHRRGRHGATTSIRRRSSTPSSPRPTRRSTRPSPPASSTPSVPLTIKEKAPERVTKLVNAKLTDKARQRIKQAKMRRHARRGGAVVAAKTIASSPRRSWRPCAVVSPSPRSPRATTWTRRP